MNILRLKLIVFCSIAFAMNGGCAIDTSLAYKYHFKADSSFQNIDTCFKYTTLAIPLLEKIEDWDKYQYDLNCLSYCYQHLEKYDEMLANNIFALSEAKKRFKKSHRYYKTALNNLGIAYRINGDYQKALDLYEEALIGIDTLKVDKGNIVGTIYENLGVVHLEKGDYDLAISYYKRSLILLRNYFRVKMKNRVSYYSREAKVNQFIAEAYRKSKQYDKSKYHLSKALKIFKENSNTHESYLFYCLLEMVDLAFVSHDLQDAKSILSELEDFNINSDRQKVQYLFRQGLYSKEIGDYSEATKLLVQAKNNCNTLSLGDQADIHKLLIDVCLKTNDEVLATEIYHDFYKQLSSMDSRIHAQELFDLNKQYLNGLIEMDKVDYFDKIKDALERHLKLSKFVISEIVSNKDRNVFLKIIKIDNEKYLNHLHDLGQTKNQKAIHSLAFALIENSKSLLLQNEFIRKNYFQDIGTQSPVFININEAERKLKQFENAHVLALNLKDKGYKSDFQKQMNDAKLLRLSDSLFVYNRKKVSNLNAMHRLLPSSFKRIFESIVAWDDLDIHSDQIFFNFIQGKKAVYGIRIFNGKTTFIAIKNDKKFVESISSIVNYNKFNSREELLAYQDASSYLIGNLLGKIPDHINQIVVSPDGSLNDISFEGLTVTGSSKMDSFRFLVEDCDVIYTFSASILDNHSAEEIEINNSMVFAPVFEGSNLYLPFSQQEFDSELFSNSEECYNACATSSALLKAIANFDLIHISSHALSNVDSKYFEPEIICRDTVVHLSDLLLDEVNAKLIVLSACETSLGKELIGEGQNSFTRTFAALGVPAVVSTLWKVNDFSQAAVMKLFYENLMSAKNCSHALSQAKRQYLSQASDINRSPYYWAGSIYLGSPNDIKFSNHSRFNFAFIVLFLICVLAIYLIAFIKKSKIS